MSGLLACWCVARTYLVVRNIIIGAHALDLHGAQHPANVIDNFYVGRGRLNNGVEV